MKKMVLMMAILALPVMSLAADKATCQAEMERKNPGLASESDAEPLSREDATNIVGLGPDSVTDLEGTELTEKDVQRFKVYLERTDTLFFSFNNDAGLWVAVAKSDTCRNLWTKQIVAY